MAGVFIQKDHKAICDKLAHKCTECVLEDLVIEIKDTIGDFVKSKATKDTRSKTPQKASKGKPLTSGRK